MEILPPGYRHGITAPDIDHAIAHALVIDQIGDDPLRYLALGHDRAGNLLELVVLDRADGPAVIHAMPMRRQYPRLLPRESG